jgi:glycosyltransferase involved in cell wall biosynthesis
VVTRSGSSRRFTVRRDRGVVLVEIPGFDRRRLGALLYYLCALPLGLVWGGAGAVYVGFQLMSPATVAAACATIRRRPFLLMSTTSGALSEVAYLRAARGARWRLPLLGRAAWLVVQTEASVPEFVGLVPRERIRVLPTPIERLECAPVNGLPRAVFTGRFSEEKDLPTLLAAWRRVAPEGACLELVGGDGPQRPVEESLRALVAADDTLRRTVSFAGWVSDTRPHLLAADVYVFPSRSEGMSNALLEACALGRVVVASDIDANTAVLGPDYPLLYRVGDQAALESVLRLALHDDGVRRRAVAEILDRMPAFTVGRVVSDLEEMLRAAAHRPRH